MSKLGRRLGTLVVVALVGAGAGIGGSYTAVHLDPDRFRGDRGISGSDGAAGPQGAPGVNGQDGYDRVDGEDGADSPVAPPSNISSVTGCPLGFTYKTIYSQTPYGTYDTYDTVMVCGC